MQSINYHNRYFKPIRTTENSDADAETVFYYQQHRNLVWATYKGGGILLGNLIAKVLPDGNLEMRYQHLNLAGDFMTGQCYSTLTILPDGRYQLAEQWQWTSGDHSSGESVIEEFIP